MPYRFKIDEPVEKGFRRIAREQLDTALAELAAPQIQPSGVHECRKALKRMRALVRLVDPALGNDKAKKRTKALSEAARLLAGRRDQAVLLDTVAKLASDTGSDGALTLAPLRAHFTRTLGDTPQLLDPDSAAKARGLLLREAKKFAHMRLRQRGFAAIEGGLEKSYRRARSALNIAYSEPSDETFHTLRKGVQWHWRQMSLLARAWPDEFAVRVAAARELSQILGDDHDLAMLIGATATAESLSDEHKDAIVGLCQRRQQGLRTAAENRAERLFAEAPKAFVKRTAAYWKFGRVVPLSDLVPTARRSEAQTAQPQPLSHSDGQSPVTEVKQGPAKPRLAAKTAASAPSQRRA